MIFPYCGVIRAWIWEISAGRFWPWDFQNIAKIQRTCLRWNWTQKWTKKTQNRKNQEPTILLLHLHLPANSFSCFHVFTASKKQEKKKRVFSIYSIWEMAQSSVKVGSLLFLKNLELFQGGSRLLYRIIYMDVMLWWTYMNVWNSLFWTS